MQAWIKMARLQFFPMAFIAYSMGAVASLRVSGRFDIPVYIMGYLPLFLIELCTIMVNEYNDYESDRINRNFSMFTGGSRMLVEGRVKFQEVRIAIASVLALIVFAGFLFLRVEKYASPALVLGLFLAGSLMGLGYTIPPIKFSHRGFGEFVVGITHTFFLVICGYVFQTGSWLHYLPWMLSIPLFFAVLAAIMLAGLPDRTADEAAAKRTIPVILGPKKAIVVAECFVTAAATSAILIYSLEFARWVIILAVILIVPHCLALLLSLVSLLRSNNFDRRIDMIMGSSLTYIIWFGLIPLPSMF